MASEEGRGDRTRSPASARGAIAGEHRLGHHVEAAEGELHQEERGVDSRPEPGLARRRSAGEASAGGRISHLRTRALDDSASGSNATRWTPRQDDDTTRVRIRPLDEMDIGAIVGIDEKITGRYRPEVWERRIGYYLRRDPEASVVAEADGRVVGFMLGEVRSGEFGLEEPTGWIEVLGVDPGIRGRGRRAGRWPRRCWSTSAAQGRPQRAHPGRRGAWPRSARLLRSLGFAAGAA